MPELWEIFSDYLYLLHHGFGFSIHAFVAMNNHYHLIATTPQSNIDAGMNHFQREVSKAIGRSRGRINQIFGGPYYPSLLDSYQYYLNAYKYLHRNPVEAGLVSRVEEYPYCTLHGLIGMSRLTIPLIYDSLLFTPSLDLERIEWLNRGKNEDFLEVNAALMKPKFRFRKNNDTGKPNRADDFAF